MAEPVRELEDLTLEGQRVRERFLELVADIRPELHRYCSRMTGSVSEGEDLVQETLARAYYALPELFSAPALRPWLFRIAHHRAIDQLRSYERRMGQPLAANDEHVDPALDPEDALAREQAVRAALSRFVELAPVQRSTVILKDVLGHSLEDIATLLELSVPAIKAALHRGRRTLAASGRVQTLRSERVASSTLARYVALFNARDWDGLRALLADDVRLDLVTRSQRAGRAEVGGYVSNYDALQDWFLVAATLDGREVIAVLRAPDDAQPAYFIELTWAAGRVSSIRDFRYVPYIAREADLCLNSTRPGEPQNAVLRGQGARAWNVTDDGCDRVRR